MDVGGDEQHRDKDGWTKPRMVENGRQDCSKWDRDRDKEKDHDYLRESNTHTSRQGLESDKMKDRRNSSKGREERTQKLRKLDINDDKRHREKDQWTKPMKVGSYGQGSHKWDKERDTEKNQDDPCQGNTHASRQRWEESDGMKGSRNSDKGREERTGRQGKEEKANKRTRKAKRARSIIIDVSDEDNSSSSSVTLSSLERSFKYEGRVIGKRLRIAKDYAYDKESESDSGSSREKQYKGKNKRRQKSQSKRRQKKHHS